MVIGIQVVSGPMEKYTMQHFLNTKSECFCIFVGPSGAENANTFISIDRKVYHFTLSRRSGHPLTFKYLKYSLGIT